MIPQYSAVAIQSPTWDCKYDIADPPDYRRNLDKISTLIDSACGHTNVEIPVRLVALSEIALLGCPDEIHNWDQAAFARSGAIEIPGDETEALGRKAREWNIFIIANAKARLPEFKDLYFNTSFVIDPRGQVIHKGFKNIVFVREHSTTPHDVYDEWIKVFGDGLDAFFPVARTEIGNIATTCCMEGSFPESFRGFALNGAEIIYRPTYPEPFVSSGIFEIQNRARALDNTCYLISPQSGPHYIDDRQTEWHYSGGRSMIVDYRGQIMSQLLYSGPGYVSAIVNIEALRDHRHRARMVNWLPYVRTEIYRKIYEAPIWPKNLYKEAGPKSHAEIDEIFYQVVDELERRGAFAPPARPAERPSVIGHVGGDRASY